MAQQAIDFNPSTGDDTTGAMRKLDNNVKDHEQRILAAQAKADAAMPKSEPVFSGPNGMQKVQVFGEFVYRARALSGEGNGNGIGGSFADWTGTRTSVVQVDCPAAPSAYGAIRWTQWGVRQIAQIDGYGGGTTSSRPSINIHFSWGAGVNQFIFNGDGSAVFAGTLVQNSDYRIKDGITPITPASAAAALRLARPIEYYDIRRDRGLPKLPGYLAHELQEVLPLIVDGEKDAVETITRLEGDTTPYEPGSEPKGWVPPVPVQVEVPKLQSVNYAGQVPYLTAGWQEHDQRIASLEAIIDELRAQLAALKGN